MFNSLTENLAEMKPCIAQRMQNVKPYILESVLEHVVSWSHLVKNGGKHMEYLLRNAHNKFKTISLLLFYDFWPQEN